MQLLMEEIAKLFAIMLMGYAVVKVGFVKSVQLILIWTHCKNMLCEEDKLEWKKVLLNVNIISIISEIKYLQELQEFNVFAKIYQISEERLTDYESGILKLKPYVTDSLERGLADNSLFFTCSVDEMYFSLMHTLLSLMEKLAVGGDILSSDQEVEGQKQFQIVTELLLRGIKG